MTQGQGACARQALLSLYARGHDKLETLSSRLNRAAKALQRDKKQTLHAFSNRLQPDMLRRRITDERRRGLSPLSTRFAGLRMSENLQAQKDQVQRLSEQNNRSISRNLFTARETLASRSRLLNTLSYKATLERGFAIVYDEKGQPLRKAEAISSGAALSLEFADGKIGAVAVGDTPAPQKTKKQMRVIPKQTELF
jgi:exodeoxyribonuclease VII large subunit